MSGFWFQWEQYNLVPISTNEVSVNMNLRQMKNVYNLTRSLNVTYGCHNILSCIIWLTRRLMRMTNWAHCSCSSSVWNGSVCRQELIYVTQLYWFYVWTINFELPEFHLLLITIYSHNLLGKILPTAPICLHKIYGSTLGNSVSWVARRCSNGFIICNLEIVGTPAHHTTTSQSTLNIPLKIGKQLMTNCIITC